MNKSGYYVYLLECSDKTLYCGITNDLQRRVRQHNDGTGAKYTRGRGPVKVLAVSSRLAKTDALRVERKVKASKRDDKIRCFKEPRREEECGTGE
jgi:putative endonuclease